MSKPNPLRIDPTRTRVVRVRFAKTLRTKFGRLKRAIIDAVDREDVFGLRMISTTLNFDPHQPRDTKGQFATTGSLKAAGSFLKSAPKALVQKVKKQVKEKYAKLERRYGPKYAKAIIGAALLGIPVPAPGASFLAAAPVLAIAELHRLVSGGPSPTRNVLNSAPPEYMTQDEIMSAAMDLIRELYADWGLTPPVLFDFKVAKDQVANTTNISVINQRWSGLPSDQKLSQFLDWLRVKFSEELTNPTDEQLWNAYIEEGFKRGAGRSYSDIKGVSEARPVPGDIRSQLGIDDKSQFLRTSLARPVNVERVKILAGQSFDLLEGVTEAMASKMSRVLTDGLVTGMGPRELARSLAAEVDLAEARAETIARTELIRAHAEGQLSTMEELGVEELSVMVEWETAHDGHVCKLCAPLQGIVLKVTEARGMIPRHPNCRCAWIPANVGEPIKGQARSANSIRARIAESVKIGRDSRTWGPGKSIGKSRPSRFKK